jgi:hypothetical protein
MNNGGYASRVHSYYFNSMLQWAYPSKGQSWRVSGHILSGYLFVGCILCIVNPEALL